MTDADDSFDDDLVDAVEEALLAVAAERIVMPTDELLGLAAERAGIGGEDPGGLELVEELEEELATHPDGPLTWLPGDRTAHVDSLTSGIVLTVRLNEAVRTVGALTVSADLAGFLRLLDPRLDGQELDRLSAEHGHLAWAHEDRGWLERFDVGDLLAVRADAVTGEVTIAVLAEEPTVDPTLVDRVRAAHDLHLEAGLPVSFEDLLHELLAGDPAAFRTPQASLSELAAAAGLEQRGRELAADPEQWAAGARARRLGRVIYGSAADAEVYGPVLELLDLLDDLADRAPVDPHAARSALDQLRDEAVLDLVTRELLAGPGLGHDPSSPAWEHDDHDPLLRTGRVLDELRAAAGAGPRVAPVELLLALVAEQDREVTIAERHLELAHRSDPDHRLVLDRLAWYASDRGDAARASRLWRRVGGPELAQDLATLEPFLTTDAGADLGRNDPCWCGSGRKHKQCHLGSPRLASLPDRVGWLCRKAVHFIERAGPDAERDVTELASARAGSSADLGGALEDPIVLDLALTEGGWFGRFLSARGSLLPDDEALLGAAWTIVERDVHEIVATDPGSTVTVRSLATGDTTVVRERTFSRQATVGDHLCARAVPDGHGHQFVGAVFSVPPGQSGALLDVLEGGDPIEIAAWVGALHAPPELRTREGERVVECEIVLRSHNPKALRRHLDRTYQTDAAGRRWSEHFDLDEVEAVVRATFTLDGDELTVSTNSDERADRILGRLATAGIDVTVVRDERRPFDLGDIGAAGGRGGLPDLTGIGGVEGFAGAGEVDVPDIEAADIERIQTQFEDRWCTEPVPALGGLTPEAAAADPTRRDDLRRLLHSFESTPVPAGAFSFRVDRLRSRLGLTDPIDSD